MIIIKKCNYCGKEFNSYESENRKYCSKECSAKSMWETRNTRRKKII